MNTITMKREFRYATVALATVAFWGLAALSVITADQSLGRVSAAASLAVKVGAIVLAAFAYMRVAGRGATIDQALFVGIGWTLMSIVTEVVVVTSRNRSWSALLGSSDHTAARDILLVTWLVAPLLFARGRL